MNPIEQAIKDHVAKYHMRTRRKPKAESGYTSSFENFWKLFKGRWNPDGAGAYGSYNKGSKAEASIVWEKLGEADRQKATIAAPLSGGKFTQDCCRWLKYKRWEK